MLPPRRSVLDDEGCVRTRQVSATEVSPVVGLAAREETLQVACSTNFYAVSLRVALRTIYLLAIQTALICTLYPDKVASLEASAHW